MANLRPQMLSFGWKQILTARKKILDAYDNAREKSKGHRVETFHGRVAEASIREWLSSFLPRRYGVTSGYIVSPGFSSEQKAPHFDVIIYDRLESPILWLDENPDSSDQGESMALPVEHVRAVFEVKSQISSSTVRDAVKHLEELRPVMEGADSPGDRYKFHLPPTFVCGMVFVDLWKANATKRATLSSLAGAFVLRGFVGGIVLRGEGHTVGHTGRLSLTLSDAPLVLPKVKGQTLLEVGQSDSTEVAKNVHIGAMLMWSEFAFAQFAFDLIAMLQGVFEVGRLSSWYGMGSSWRELLKEVGAKPNGGD